MFNSYVAMLERAGLAMCVLLAAVSTTAWYLLQRAVGPFGDVGVPWPSDSGDVPGWLLLWSTGSIYSALVLFRYVGVGARARAGVLAVAGALSYWIGVRLSIELSPTDNLVVDTAIAGAVTAAGLGFLVIRLGTLRFSPLHFAALCAAGGLGGALIAMDGFEMGTFIFGHAAWQILTCVSLYFAPRMVPAAAASSGN